MELGMVVHACNPNIQEVDEGVRGSNSNCLASLGYTRLSLSLNQNGGSRSPVELGCLFAMGEKLPSLNDQVVPICFVDEYIHPQRPSSRRSGGESMDSV